ncbi:MAG: hypothetical protein LAN71_16595 [Acidobacteriia bacterium]|nr:hypothetical protein [Terriglobia bacterium]
MATSLSFCGPYFTRIEERLLKIGKTHSMARVFSGAGRVEFAARWQSPTRRGNLLTSPGLRFLPIVTGSPAPPWRNALEMDLRSRPQGQTFVPLLQETNHG